MKLIIIAMLAALSACAQPQRFARIEVNDFVRPLVNDTASAGTNAIRFRSFFGAVADMKTNGATAALYIRESGGGARVALTESSGNGSITASDSSAVTFFSATPSQTTISSTFTDTGSLRPIATSTYSLGTTTRRWSNAFTDNLRITTGFRLDAAPTAGFCLISDASGNGTWQACGGGTALPVVDTQTITKNAIDATKLMRFSNALQTTGTTRVLTNPDADITLAGINLAQTWTATQDFQTIQPSATSTYSLGGSVRRWTNLFTDNVVVTTGFRLGTSTTAGWVLTSDASGNAAWSAASGGISSLNSLSGSSQSFAVGMAGSDFNISSSGTTHTFNLPDAGASTRGAVTASAQTFAGAKTFTGNILTSAAVGMGSSAVGSRFSSAHIQNITSRTDANGIGALYVRDSSNNLMAALYDTNGSGGQLVVNDASSASILLATTSGITIGRSIIPATNYANSLGDSTHRVDVNYGRFLNLRTNGGSLAGINAYDNSNTLTFSMGDSGGFGGEFHMVNGSGSYYFEGSGGQLRFNGTTGFTGTATAGTCTLTIKLGGITGTSGC